MKIFYILSMAIPTFLQHECTPQPPSSSYGEERRIKQKIDALTVAMQHASSQHNFRTCLESI